MSTNSNVWTVNTNTGSNSKMFNSRIRDRICDLSKTLAAAESTEEFMKDMVQFYKDFGVGKLGLHKDREPLRSYHCMTDIPGRI